MRFEGINLYKTYLRRSDTFNYFLIENNLFVQKNAELLELNVFHRSFNFENILPYNLRMLGHT